MRMVDADQVHAAIARRLVGLQQVFGTQFIACRLRAFEGIVQRDRLADILSVAIDRAQHCAAALVRIRAARMGDHRLPRFSFDADHSSSQKCSERYFSALSQSTVTMMPVSPREAMPFATIVAACTLQPEEIPTSRPSSRASRRTIAYASSVSIHRFSS